MSNHQKGILRIGTSGIAVPGTKQHFPPEFQLKSRLNYYSSLFNTVEINSTFYKIPMSSTFEKWSLDVSDEFRFTVKLWREITHVKHLDCDLDNIDLFLNAAKPIANKKGCLLVQFPGSITAEFSAPVEWILQRFQALDPQHQWRKAIEFRSMTWYNNHTYDLLDQYNASIVLHDMPKSKNVVLNEAATFVYCRFHGLLGDYKGSYSNNFLEEQSAKIRGWLNDGKDVYAYFNNTIGNAFENAMTLKGMVEK